MNRIRISIGKVIIDAELFNTPTANAILNNLPFASKAQTWGEEVYFSTPVSTPLEADAREVVEPGTVCFWVQGNALALPFGPTPASHADECRLVTRVNVLGMIEGDPRQLADIGDGDQISVSEA